MNVTYGADGYAVRATNYEHAIFAGAKKSERAPSVDTVRSAADRSVYGGSVCDQRHFSDRELAHAAELREQAASGALTPAQAHRFIEAIRAMYGYSGGSGGNEYAALDLPDERPPETRRTPARAGSAPAAGREAEAARQTKPERQADAERLQKPYQAKLQQQQSVRELKERYGESVRLNAIDARRAADAALAALARSEGDE